MSYTPARMRHGDDFLYRPCVPNGPVAHWELYAWDHLDLLAFRRANVHMDVMAENGRRRDRAARARAKG